MQGKTLSKEVAIEVDGEKLKVRDQITIKKALEISPGNQWAKSSLSKLEKNK